MIPFLSLRPYFRLIKSKVLAIFSILTISFRDTSVSPLSLAKSEDKDPVTCSTPTCFPYVFTTFGGTNGRNEKELDIYTSEDGIHWETFLMGAYKPKETLLRDPSLMLHEDGWYYIAHTTGWNGDDFAIIRSKNLEDWEQVTRVKSSNQNLEVAQTWAPEFFRDPVTGAVHVIVSLRKPSAIPPTPDPAMKTTFFPYIFTATSADLKSWTSAELLDIPEITGSLASKPNQSYIDMFVIYNREDKEKPYYGYMKDEVNKYIEHLVAPSVHGPWEFVQRGDFAGWGVTEGPAVVELPNGMGWRMLADDYHGHVMFAESQDLWNWTKMTDLPNGVAGRVRHGTVLYQGA